MKVDGACFCRQITYEAELNTDRILICNCTDCQTLSGSAFRTVAFTKEDAFTLLSGELKIYVKIADSGNPRQQSFCGTCGSPIYATSDPAGPFYGLRVGSITQRDQLVPRGPHLQPLEAALARPDSLAPHHRGHALTRVLICLNRKGISRPFDCDSPCQRGRTPACRQDARAWARAARRRACGSSSRLRRRIDAGVTSSSSSSAM